MSYAQESQLADENLCRLRTAVYLASQVGAQLGQREILLEALSLGKTAKDGMNTSLGASEAARKNPEHRISIGPTRKTWVAMLGEQEIARSDRALLLSEAGYSPVVYFPPDDVRTDALRSSDTQSHCPFKGDASYWAADIDGERVDIGWYYPKTFDEVQAIAGFIAFYKGRVVVQAS